MNVFPIPGKSIPEQIWEHRRELHVTQPIMLDFPDGIRYWICPPGFARGYNEFSNRALTLWPEVTCWPKKHSYALCFGWNNPTQIYTRAGSTLWPLELMVYIRERSTALARAMEAMDKIFPIPREKGHKENDTTPFPEDFGIRNKEVGE